MYIADDFLSFLGKIRLLLLPYLFNLPELMVKPSFWHLVEDGVLSFWQRLEGSNLWHVRVLRLFSDIVPVVFQRTIILPSEGIREGDWLSNSQKMMEP